MLSFLSKHKVKFEILYVILNISSLFFLSIFDVDGNNWVWLTNKSTWIKFINVFVAFSGIFGILSSYAFARHLKFGYFFGLINTVFYMLFAFSNQLIIDGFINLFMYIPILLFSFFKTKIKKQIKFEYFVSTIYTWSFFIVLIILFWVIFYFLSSPINNLFNIIFNLTPSEFGSFYKYQLAGKILISLINSLSVVALLMLSLGFKENWYVWLVKNIFSYIFFGGIGFLSVTVILINVVFMNLSLYFYFISDKTKEIRIYVKDLKPDNLIYNSKFNFVLVEGINEITYSLKQGKDFFKLHLKEFKKTFSQKQNILNFDLNKVLNTINLNIKLKNKREKILWKAQFYIFKLSILLRPKYNHSFSLLEYRDYVQKNIN
ncbi:nicotinamide mononucleotide transporter family protein [Mycoplasmopsis felis]|uniref:nicotinamide mononucleotide transporter family protein n=1 Tax=Mycoplasmopsis felis TaxID=33923 RepID=UPI0021B0687C|nr:nicotinamide mononucleotide transporter family protein [Mycoplasmopsis felis]MCU9931489.1 nicotinamide mononucleotide transporter family protein [Mycoplasmopsis felis]MCU9937256.1 nicotinamide mononucleotide transporter family protein [Mycoplasmopsis felis]UWV78891.1 nicotinamide mononucleotide transporter family protein [Mycoplasmopsis felis]WQQ09432.1 nicotinamide mononucleotide transporter family protein [Mycoplasmopsis felis]